MTGYEYLDMYYALYRSDGWDTGELTNRQVAAAEIDALIWWGYANMTFDHYREGLIDPESWAENSRHFRLFLKLPVYRAVYDKWWSRTPSEFTHLIDKMIENDA